MATVLCNTRIIQLAFNPTIKLGLNSDTGSDLLLGWSEHLNH